MSEEEKEYKPVDDAFKDKITDVADNLYRIKELQDENSAILKQLKKDYGIAVPIMRQVATVQFKHNQSEIEEKHETLMELIERLLG